MGAVQVLASAPAPAPRSAPWPYQWKKRAVAWARWLHIYLSMISFAILFFFAATGLTLNHQDWFAAQQRTMIRKGTLDRAWLGEQVAKLEIVERLRRAQGIRAGLSDFRIDDKEITVNFKGPGYTADTFIDRASGSYELTETRMGWGAVINDLHKGRDAGRVWGLLIDASAVFMTLVSMTGLVLIAFLSKRRRSAFIMLGAGAVVCNSLYLLFVP
jgi:uncharacterized protein